ncbi:MAG: peptidylprolyl isomerase, partial [Bacteroidota bacterium]
MKFINSRLALLAVLAFFTIKPALAQEIIPESVLDSVKPKIPAGGRIKIDGVIAVVGDFVVLDSDIDFTYIELQQQGASLEGVTRCELAGKLMEDKLYAHHAVQDSIIVSDAEVNGEVNQRLDYFTERLGSPQKVVEYFKKKDLETFRSELFDIIKSQKLTEEMRKKIIDEVEITPEEVRQFYIKFKPEERPIFGA